MGKWTLKDWVLVVGGGVLIINTLKLHSVEQEIQSLRQDNEWKVQRINNAEDRLQHEIHRGYEEIEQALKKQQSLFSAASAEMKLKGGKIMVTMKAVPKEIKSGEKLFARLSSEGKVYEKEVNENNTASFEIDFTEKIQPAFVLKSETGIRQEVLEEQYTSELFTNIVTGDWDSTDESKVILKIGIEGELPFKESEIEKAEVIAVDTGIEVKANSAYGFSSSTSSSDSAGTPYPTQDIEGTVLPLTKVEQEGNQRLEYSIDLQKYAEEEDGRLYAFYFAITTKEGMKYITPYNYIASLSCSEDGISMGCGQEMLLPLMKP